MTRSPRALSRPLRCAVAAAAALVGVTGLATPGAQAAAASAPLPPVITADYFGTHHAGLGTPGTLGWPRVANGTIGSVRLWDNRTAWNQIETAPGSYDWSHVDQLVGSARAHGARVLLVLGQTPTFYASNPAAAGSYGAGATSMPTSEAAWKAYVAAVATRNATTWGNAADLQVWNEANVGSYWSGSPGQMALLTTWTRQALQSVGSRALLVAPALVTRLSSQQAWIKAFYAQKVGGRNVSAYVDALSFQLYPLAAGKPEDSMKLLGGVKAVLKRNHVSKPIFNTEVNYGLVGGAQAGAPAAVIPAAAQASNVARTLLLNAQNGVRRVYWYSWDLTRMSNTPMVGADGASLTSAGRAYGVVRSWILGTRPAGCQVRAGTYTCTFTVGRSVRRAVWVPTGRAARVTVPGKTRTYRTVDGRPHPTKPGRKVTVGLSPVLFLGSR